MAKNKFNAKELSTEDLVEKLENTELSFQKVKFDHAITGLDKPVVIREMRRDIARMKEEIRSREIKNMSEEELAKRSKIRFRRRKSK